MNNLYKAKINMDKVNELALGTVFRSTTDESRRPK